jgi:light-regulated signal transduction histidine kinase (bacteriophytochrome)
MGMLIDDLLKLARVTRVEIRTEDVDLSGMAREIAAELQRATPERLVEFAIAPGLRTRGDARLLRVALDNLLRNSWKYTAKQPEPRIEFQSVDANGGQAFMVRDNGAGFDMQYADKLFGVFQRLHSPAEFEGTGVGLATVRRIITRHGGRIWAEGVVDRGATFYFTL